jgi:hypothetical protein
MDFKMNDSLDLRNRILKMRESNNLTVTKQDASNNNLMSEFESSIKDDNKKEKNSDQGIVIDKNKEIVSNSTKNNSENIVHNRDKTENQNINKTVNNNEAQFLMLANKFNEAVEVILELSHKVEKLERNASQKSYKQTKNVNSSSFLNIKIFVFLLLIPIMILGFFTLPFDISSMKSIIFDILSTI